ncbi:hypothetical protein GCM10028810_63530 [Spirosoma litoris]
MSQAQQVQNYPVQTTAYFAAPFSQRLSDYFSSDKRLLVDLLLKDLTKSTVQVYLKWSIEGVGIRVQSRDTYLPPSFITLQRGVVNRLKGSDLQTNYFNPAAIETQGIDPRSVYAIELPEGFYTLKVQAFEAATGQVVSNVSETYMVLAYPQPPILNLPMAGTEVPVTSLQKVPISWAPRHFASPTTQAVYHLQVCQVPDDFEPTELVMLTCTEPRLNETVPTTSYAADITQWIKPLEVGKRYVVQVTVSDLSGELTNFVNQGRSQVSWFRYGKECTPPAFTIQSLGTDRVQLSWERTEGAQGYVVEYKLATAANWQTVLVSGTSQVIGSLNPTADYLFRMRTDCGGSAPSAPSEIQTWNIRDEAPDVAPELPLELTNPIAIRVQTGVDGQTQIPTSLSALYTNFPRAIQSATSSSGTGVSSGTDPGGVTTPPPGVINEPNSPNGGVVTNSQTSPGATSTGTTSTNTDLPLLTLPYCAVQASSFAGCELPHPSVGLPTGERELTSLSVGDVLGIYDYAVFVTKVGGGSPLSGEGLARLPFLNGTMVLVEFSGVSAKAGEPGTNGGCVYAVPESGYFRIKRATQAEVLSAQRGLIASLVSKTTTDSTTTPGSSTAFVPFVGTLGEALAKYDSVVVRLTQSTSQTVSAETRQALIQYTGAIAQGSASLKSSFDAVYGDSSDPLVVSIRDSLAVLMNQVNQTLTTLQRDSAVTDLSVLSARYEALFVQINKLTNSTTTLPTVPGITPVVLSKLTDTSVTLSWQGDASFTKYVVHYKLENGGELLQTVTSPSIQLLNLKPGSNYTYTVEGYQGTNLVSSYQGPFTTLSTEVPIPQNLTYTVQDDNTLTISWDTNSLYKGYKLVYKDLAGVERTVYPTTNQVKLTGLDPTQTYTYELVGYSSTNESSAPAGGRLASGPSCALSIDDRNATNSSITNGHVLLATGCVGGKLTWSNGTPGTITNNTITWADGETGELGGIFLGDHAVGVTPKKNTTYTAICQMGSGSTQKSCTYSVDVNISSPECQGSFQISASTTSIEKGGVVTLTATGCDGSGKLIWNNGLGDKRSIQIAPLADIIVSAECVDGTKTCYANAIPLTIQTCITALYINYASIYTVSSGIFGLSKKTRKDVDIGYVGGCETSKVQWSIVTPTVENKLPAGTVTSTRRVNNQFYLEGVEGSVTVLAVCTSGANCPPVTLTIPEPSQACDRHYLAINTTDKIPAGFVGVSSGYAFTLKDATGKVINATEATKVNVPVSPTDKLYTATFANGCTASILVPRTPIYQASIAWTESISVGNVSKSETPGSYQVISPTVVDAFILTTYPAYNQYYNLDMQLSSPCPGIITWTNSTDAGFSLQSRLIAFRDNTFSPVEPPINVVYLPFPTVTTTYYAACHITNADGSETIYPATHPKTIVITSDACMRIDVATPSVTKGKPVKLTAVGCIGDVSWSAGDQLVGVGPILTHTPVPATTPSAYLYTATCSNPACDQTVTVQVKNCQFTVTPAQKAVKIAEAVVLTTAGCDDGLVQWNTGETGASITAKPLENTTYTATCLVDGVAACQNSAQLTVDNKEPDDVECPPFELISTTQSVMRCTTQLVTITPQGCPAGSTIAWSDGHTSGPDEIYKLTLNQGTTITATCTTPYQIQVTQQIILATQEPTLEITSTEVYAGFPARLHATGCFSPTCQEGQYSWSVGGKPVGSGSSLLVTLLAETAYTVTCNGKTSATKTIKLKEGDCDRGLQVDNKSGNISTSQYYISASWCDTNYDIQWKKKTRQGDQYVTQDYPAGRGKRRFTVNRPPLYQFYFNGQPLGDPQPDQDLYMVSCVRNGTPCMYSDWVVISYDPGFPDIPGSYISGGPAEAPSTPGPCNESVGMEKGAIQNFTYSASGDGSYYRLYTDWCSGKVVWTDKAGAVLTTLTVGPFTSAPTYHYSCTLASGGLCEGDYTLPPPDPSGGRVGAPPINVSTGVSNNCSSEIEFTKAMLVFYDKMLCQLKNLIQTPDDAQTVLSSLQQQLSGTAVVFPADLSAVIDALVNKDCDLAIKLLAAANGSTTIDETEFNTTINSQFKKIQSRIIDTFKADAQIIGETVQQRDLAITVTVSASDQNQIDDSQERIAFADRRNPIAIAEDRQSHTNRPPISPDGQDYFREICTVWNTANQAAYAQYLTNVVTIPTPIAIGISQLQNKPLLFPALVQDGTLSNLSENFLKTFFLNKIKGYASQADGIKSLYTGTNKPLYETVATQLVNHFYEKSGADYFQMKAIADAIYSTNVGNRRINNMIQIVDGLFFRKIGNLAKPQDSDPTYYKTGFVGCPYYCKPYLDLDWFNKFTKINVFPSFGPTDALTFDPRPGIGDDERLGLYTIGGTQGIEVRVKEITPIITPTRRGYEATIIIRYLDTFGVSENDYAKDLSLFTEHDNLLGQDNFLRFNYRGGVLSQWILQHQYGYSPFTDYLTYIITMKHTWEAN